MKTSGWIKIVLITVIAAGTAARVSGQAVTTVAGSAGIQGTANGPGNVARFNSPHGIACDKFGNIYVADRMNHRIRKIDFSGAVTTLAGTGVIGGTDGPGNSATFNEPWAVACDTLGNVYVADTRNYKIRKITPTGSVVTVAGQGTFGTTNGPALLAKFGFPSGICVTPDGATIYVADHNTHVIRKIFNGTVSNLTGITYIAGADDGGPGTATFNHPYGIDLDNSGNIIVADEWNNMIRLVTSTGNVVTLAGVGLNGSSDGQPTAAMFNYPWDVTVDSSGNIFVADGYNHTIRKLEYPFWMVSTYAGTAGVTGATDATGPAASFNTATGVAFNPFNKAIYVGDESNELVRKIASVSPQQITLSTAAVNSTVCYGDSIPVTSSLSGLSGYIYYDNGNVVATSASSSINLPPLASGNHTITCSATDSAGLTVLSNNLVVTVKAQYIPLISPANPVFCNGDSIQLNVSVAVSYLWNQGSTSQSIYISNGGIYSVTATAADGCKGTTTVNATASNGPPAIINAASGSPICPGDSVLITASTGTSYLWSDGSTTQSIYAGAVQPYYVTVSDVAGCTTMSSAFNINFYPNSLATISPGGPIVILQNDSVTLNSGNAATYSWSTGATSQSIVVNSNGNYMVTITTSDGCSSVSSAVQVIVISQQQIVSATGNLSFCQGLSVTLQSFFSQGNQWYFNGALMAGENSQELSATDSGYYQVAIYQNGNWIFSDSILVTVYTTPQMASVTDTTICEGEAPLLVALAEPLVTVKWYDQDIGGNLLGMGSAYQTTPVIQPEIYYIEVTGLNGCIAERTPLYISTNPTPVADFTYTIAGQPGNFTVTFNNISLFADTYNWSLQDTGIQTSQVTDPSFSVFAEGEYGIWLLADNSYGCTDSLYKKIYIGNGGDWFIPNTFTPNNDGKNDFFKVRGRGVTTREMKIYDQWGTLLFMSAVDPVWDGTVNGQTVQNGTYMYHVVISQNDQEEVVSGAITVIK
jgi:gliding motility-associated-like protein